jgi:peroxiredoxin
MRIRAFLRSRFLWGIVCGAVLTVAVEVLAVWLLLYLNKGTATADLRQPPLPMAQQADYDWEIETLAGEAVPFSEFRGRPVFLTIFRPSCHVCELELPHLQSLYEQTADLGVAHIAISIQQSDKILSLIADYGLTFPVYVTTSDRPDVFKTGTVPSTFIITPEGKIAFVYKGPAQWDDASVVSFLKELAKTNGEAAPLSVPAAPEAQD